MADDFLRNAIELIQSGDFDRFLEALNKQLNGNLKGAIREQLQLARVSYVEGLRLIQDMGFATEPLLREVAAAFVNLAETAKERDWSLYLRFGRAFEKQLVHDLHWVRTVGTTGFLLMNDYSNLAEVMHFMREGLEFYISRLRYYCGLMKVASGKRSKMSALLRLNWTALESRLTKDPNGVGIGLLLGDEYRRIRNSLTHHSFEVVTSKRAIRFENPNHRGRKPRALEYTYTDFAAMHRIFQIVFLGLELATSAETLLSFEFMSRVEGSRVAGG